MIEKIKKYWQTKMTESKFTSNIVLIIVEAIVALVAAGAVTYASMLNGEIDRLEGVITKTEARVNADIIRLSETVDRVAADQKLTIEKLHAEYCGIQKSLADINVAVTALNSRLISRDDVEKIAHREAVLYHQACEAQRRQESNKK